jgi:predicted ATPase/class 3 adenylate cyclase
VAVRANDQSQQLPKRPFFHHRITERQVRIESIVVAAAVANAPHVPGLLQIAQQAVRIALGDLGSLCDLLHPRVWIAGDREQDLGVIGDERPSLRRRQLPRAPPLCFTHSVLPNGDEAAPIQTSGTNACFHDPVRELPRGTVTLLFTDIEGSTRLLHDLGEGYAQPLAEHRRVLRRAFQAHGGVEVDTQGDAFFYAFERASDAAAAAEEAQTALAGGPIRVRMGLHTGEPQVTAEGYVGLDVHKGARVATAAHGGQVLLSQATRELVEADMLDLGEHRLKDFAEPIWIYQLGQARFPPLKTISNTNLPRPASSFIGRGREVADVVSLLRNGARLVTLSGPGGAGKTRLALESAAELVPEYRNGVFWVGLAALRDPALALETVAQTLGAKEELAAHIGERELLLLLDNFEQVVDAASELSPLLRACANLCLLVTSRELLRIEGEVEYAVPPLAAHEAVELFCARAQLDADETIASLCRRLDNLPLAVELAAARTAVLSPGQILERLSQRLDLLAGGRDAEARQQTLRATLEWSRDLLSPEEQYLFARLSVFAGGCTLEAAADVCDAEVDTLQSLVDKSLLRHTEERFWMLETIREFAAERVEESGEAEELRSKHAAYFLELFEARDNERRKGRVTLSEYVGLVRGEQDNARGALAWYRAAGDADRAARLGVALHPLWMASSVEGRRALDEVLAEKSVAGDLRGRALWAAATVAGAQGDSASQKRFLDEALPLFRELGDRASLAEALRRRAGGAIRDGQFERARELLRESEGIAAEIGDRGLLAAVANAWAHIPLYQGDYEQAEVLFEEALQRAREAEDPGSVKFALTNLGLTVLEQGRLADAGSLFRASLDIRVELTQSSADAAVEGFAAIAIARSDAATAARLLGATAEWRKNVGFRQEPFESTRFDRTAAAARSALGEEAYGVLIQEGAALDLDEAVELALAIKD